MNKNVILITGANSNIGSKLAESFLADDYTLLLLVHNNQDKIKHLKSRQDKVFVTACDLTNWEETNAAVQQLIIESELKPYALIHTSTARSNDSLPLLESDTTKWAEVLQTNVLSTYHILRAALPYLVEQHEGKIILFGSDVSRSGLAYGTAYSASKAAIANIAKSLALELADSGVLINTLSPGPVLTDDRQFDLEYREFRRDYFQKQLARIPLNRYVNISDIYHLCRFMVSEHNSYLTGEEIFLTGGKQ